MLMCINYVNYPLQVEDGGHLCESSKLIPDGPGGHGGEVCHKRPKLFVELQPSELQQNDQHSVKQHKRYIVYAVIYYLRLYAGRSI